jgi:hypothetical protein
MAINYGKLEERDAAICRYYTEGHKISECAATFNLGRQRVHQILKKAGVWKPFDKQSTRTAFLGINVTNDTKSRLVALAERRGLSVSKLAANVLDAVVRNKEITR